jgi:hypothetical protein
MLQPILNDQELRSAAAVSAAGPTLVRRVVRNMAAVDWIAGLYFGVIACALLATRHSNWEGSLKDTCIDWTMLVLMLVLVRGEVIRGAAASSLYRVGITAPIMLSYFQLRWILPAVTSRSLDPQIYAFDLHVFHYEPSVAWDHFVNPSTVEWFAFFYFGYFVILMANVLPFLAFGTDGKLLRHFGTGLTAQFCITHLLYMVVPGFGPYHELRFGHELHGGVFWALVLHSVHSAGALKDIFPSLHTGAPTFMAIFAFVHRKHLPFKYAWPVLAFCCLQIIGATMFLRWHYLIDIVAGFTLATFNVLFWGRVVDWETARRERLGLPSIFGMAPVPWLLERVRRSNQKTA